jgi:hypothetical protein
MAILISKETRNADRLRAAAMIGKWAGLEPVGDRFLPDRLAEAEKRELREYSETEYRMITRQRGAHQYRMKSDPKYARLYNKFKDEISELQKNFPGYLPLHIREKITDIQLNLNALLAHTYDIEFVPNTWEGKELEALLIHATRILLEDDGDDDKGDHERV